MKLTVIGCSPAWPNPGGAHSGYLFEGASGRLLVDCGPGVLQRLRQREGWPRVDAIAILAILLLNAALGFTQEFEAGRALDALNTAVYKRFHAEGIQIPFPQRDVHLYHAAAPEEPV